MRPEAFKTRIFLDGQTTNPTLISRNPEARKHLERGGVFTPEEIQNFYREVVQKISRILPQGSISVEVYADASTKAEEMISQGREMFSWINNAHIKYPTTPEGLKAANQSLEMGLRVNMTLCFSQEQAAGVYAATRGASKGTVFISPFVGRLDDRGENGMDLIANMIRLYRKGDGHVEVLTASVRTLDHLMYALHLGSDIITAPFKVLEQWADQGMPLPDMDYNYDRRALKEIPFKDFDLNREWRSFDLSHDLTAKGLESFSKDWNSLINPPGKK
jgi:transaldolase